MAEDPYKIEKKDGLISGSMGTTTNTTSANQNLASGSLEIKDDGVFYTPKDSVAGQLSGLLANESPYITSARANAAQSSNQRGLINSTMAATAGEKAAIDSATPIAQQDAGYYQDLSKAEKQGDISSRLQSEQGDINSRLQGEQGKIQEGLYKTQGNITAKLNKESDARQLQRETQLAKLGYTHEAAMKKADIEWNKFDLNARMQVEYDKMAQDKQTDFNQTASEISADYQQNYLEILADPTYATPADRQQAINVLNQATQQRYNIAAAVAEVDLTWSPSNSLGGATQEETQQSKPSTNNNSNTNSQQNPAPAPQTQAKPDRWQDRYGKDERGH